MNLLQRIFRNRKPMSPIDYKCLLESQLNDGGVITPEFDEMYGYDTAHNLGIYMDVTMNKVCNGVNIYSHEYVDELITYGESQKISI